jgi:hypothetical protein
VRGRDFWRPSRLWPYDGRSLDDLDVALTPFSHPVGTLELRQYAAAGVDQVVVNAPLVVTERVGEALRDLAGEVSVGPGPGDRENG